MSMAPNDPYPWMRAPDGPLEDDEDEVASVAPMTGPYLLTHKKPSGPLMAPAFGLYQRLEVLSRQAFATLKEAREGCVMLAPVDMTPAVAVSFHLGVYAIGESGGSVSLPDGSSLTVEPVTYGELYDALPHRVRITLDRTSHAAIREHFNARNAAQGEETK